MKKNLKKTLSLALAIMMIFAVSITAFAADITKDQAQQIALKDAGYAAADVINLKVWQDNDDGVKVWEVDFLVEENRLYKEYDYEIRVSDGVILEKDWDYEDDYIGAGGANSGVQAALERIERWLEKIFNYLKSIFG